MVIVQPYAKPDKRGRGVRLRPSIDVENTTFIQLLRLFTRIVLIGGMLTLAMTLGSLLHSELARAWASQLRRIVKRSST